MFSLAADADKGFGDSLPSHCAFYWHFERFSANQPPAIPRERLHQARHYLHQLVDTKALIQTCMAINNFKPSPHSIPNFPKKPKGRVNFGPAHAPSHFVIEDDQRVIRALTSRPNIHLYRYRLSFRLD